MVAVTNRRSCSLWELLGFEEGDEVFHPCLEVFVSLVTFICGDFQFLDLTF